jgi:thioredoxin-related protein
MSKSVLVALLALTYVLSGCSREKSEVPATPPTETVKSSVVLIVHSEACQCTREKCAETQDYVTQALRRYALESRLSVVDYAKENKKAVELFRKYGVHFIPVVLVFDDEGGVLYKNESELDKGEFEKALAGLKVK